MNKNTSYTYKCFLVGILTCGFSFFALGQNSTSKGQCLSSLSESNNLNQVSIRPLPTGVFDYITLNETAKGSVFRGSWIKKNGETGIVEGTILQVYPFHFRYLNSKGLLDSFEKGDYESFELTYSPTGITFSGGSFTKLMTDLKNQQIGPETVFISATDENEKVGFFYGQISFSDGNIIVLHPSGSKTTLGELSEIKEFFIASGPRKDVLFPNLKPKTESEFFGYLPAPDIELTNKIHQEITSDLFNGEVTESYPLKGGLVYDVTLRVYDPSIGDFRYRRAILKARIPGDKKAIGADPFYDGYGRTPMEYVAYFLNRLLKMDIFPPTAYRNNLNFQLINGQRVNEGALIYFVPGFTTHKRGRYSSNYAILNRMMKNPDGNIYNSGYGQHWVSGLNEFIAVDFSASRSNMHRGMGESHQVLTIERPVYEALKKMTAADFRPVIEVGFITEEEVKSTLEEGKLILEIIHELVAKKKALGLPESLVITQ